MMETFAPLEALPGFRHAFIGRAPGIDVAVDRETALARLEGVHRDAITRLGLGDRVLKTATQVHGAVVEAVTADTPSPVVGADGLVTNDPHAVLGIYVADCGALYLADPVRRAIGLVHSGRKGTELGIAAKAVAKMRECFGSDPGELVAVLGPCIRPPHYEVDFAADIVAQLRAAGVQRVYDCKTCTASHPERYYSYRREQGRTGRMLAVLALDAVA